MRGVPLEVCMTFVGLGCDGNDSLACRGLRTNLQHYTGSRVFPFEFTKTPTPLPTNTAEPTASAPPD